MKLKLLLPLILFTCNNLYAQKEEHLPCNCEALESKQKKYIEDEKSADSLLQQYITRLWKFSKIKKINDPFEIREAFCASPVSQICETRLPNGTKSNVRLILYGDTFLKNLNTNKKEITLVDKQVLLHEIGHHVLGHHKNAQSSEALTLLYQQKTANPKLWNKYGSNNPMAQELEADIFAVWALSKLEKGFTVNQLVSGLNKEMIKSLDKASTNRKLVNQESGGKYMEHPLFKDRIEIMRKFEIELKKSGDREPPRRYFADIASTAYLDLWPESYIYDVSLSLGTSVYGKTDFKVEGEKVDAFLYPVDEFTNYQIGLSIDRFRWDRPWQTGLDLQWSQHKYGTTIPSIDGDRLAETINVRYITFTPKLTWSSIGKRKSQSLHSLRFGFLAGIGLNARIPVGDVGYVNYISNATPPELRFSIGPKVTVGAALLKKSFLPRGFKVLLSYDPQWIRLKSEPAPSAVSHNIELTLQCSLIRW